MVLIKTKKSDIKTLCRKPETKNLHANQKDPTEPDESEWKPDGISDLPSLGASLVLARR